MQSENTSPADRDRDELEQALLAAFGDDALDIFDDDDDDGFPPQVSTEGRVASQSPQSQTPDRISQVLDVGENASPLIRYMQNLNRTIYGCIASGTNHHDQPTVARVTSKSPRFVVFSIGDQQFGLPLGDVREIARYPKVSELPYSPDWLRGVANLRGQILSVTDLRHLLQISGEQPVLGEKIIVIYSPQIGATTALVVDRVQGIRCYASEPGDSDQLSPQFSSIANGTAMINQSTTVLIDADRLLGCVEIMDFVRSK